VSAGGPAVRRGDVVTVLEWLYDLEQLVPYTGTVQALDSGDIRVSHRNGPGHTAHGPGLWARKWRLPAPEELAAYQLSQLTSQGL
jgi:hypothetical protein